jgi:hypothetical protein
LLPADLNGTGVDVSHPIPWYAPTGATLLAAGIAALAAVLTAHWNRRQQLTDRRVDWAERRTQEAQVRAEVGSRESRMANRAAWATQLHRIDELLVAAAEVAYEAQRRRLHDDDPEATELVRLCKASERYAAYAPGSLPTALDEVTQAVREVHRLLLPRETELHCIDVADTRTGGYRPILTKAGDQARAADRLTVALTAARNAMHHEWRGV